MWYNKYMKITKKQFQKIERYFPVQRGNVKINNYDFINAILYIAENGCKWRALPKEYGNWNSIYKRFNRWVNNGVIQRIFTALQQEKIISIKVEVLALDSTSCKVHPDGHGCLKNTESSVSESRKADGIPSFTWYPQMTRQSLKCIYPEEINTTLRKVGFPLKK
jgi:transposase